MKIVSQEVAKLAHKYDFNEPCEYYYEDGFLKKLIYYGGDGSGEVCNNSLKFDRINCEEMDYTAPYQAQLQEWFRNDYNIHITIFSKSQESWMFRITTKGQGLEDGIYGEDFKNYEEALEDALLESFKLID